MCVSQACAAVEVVGHMQRQQSSEVTGSSPDKTVSYRVINPFVLGCDRHGTQNTWSMTILQLISLCSTYTW